MKKIVQTVVASVVLTGAIGAAGAHERHHVRTYHRMAPIAAQPYQNPYAYRYRDSYAWSSPREDYGYWESHLEGGAISAPAGH
jgi:hypothetical protein